MATKRTTTKTRTSKTQPYGTLVGVRLHLTGTRPILLHNGRLANPFDPWTQNLKKLTEKRKKTEDDQVAIVRMEARAGVYEDTQGRLAVPTGNVWRSIYDAAKQFKLGETIKRALRYDPMAIEPLLVAGQAVDVDTYLQDPSHIDANMVRVGRNRVLRARTIVHEWSTVHQMELDKTIVDLDALTEVFDYAGRNIGLGDRRPLYGTYRLEVTNGITVDENG